MGHWEIASRLVHVGPVGDPDQEAIVILLKDGADEYWVGCHAAQPHPPSYSLQLETGSLPLRIQNKIFSGTIPRTVPVAEPVDVGKVLSIYTVAGTMPLGVITGIEGVRE